MSLKVEEIRDLLAQKFRVERKRLKTYGTKIDSFQMANVVCRYVQALMCDSRNRELKRLGNMITKARNKHGDKKVAYYTQKYLQERIKATRRMAKAIKHVAEDTEKKRPWKKTVAKLHKHKHRSK